MGKKRNSGNGRLDESLQAMQQALAQMLQAQTAFLARVSETDAELVKFRREIEQTNLLNGQRFARIEALLAEHSRILAELPEAVHRRFGFQPPRPPTE